MAVTDILRAWGTTEKEMAPDLLLMRVCYECSEKIAACAIAIAGGGEGVAAVLARTIGGLLAEDPVKAFLQVNAFQGEWFFHKEYFGRFCERLTVTLLWELNAIARKSRRENRGRTGEALELLYFLPSLAERAKYRLDALREALSSFSGK